MGWLVPEESSELVAVVGEGGVEGVVAWSWRGVVAGVVSG
jgi:hypothetical protein